MVIATGRVVSGRHGEAGPADVRGTAIRVQTGGWFVDEESDGTIWVLNKKIYLYDKNGEPDGAAWIEEWITFDGKVVRKGEPKRQEEVLDYKEAVKLRRTNRLRAADRDIPQMPPTGSSR